MTNAPPDDDLGDRLRRLAVWADAVPPHARGTTTAHPERTTK